MLDCGLGAACLDTIRVVLFLEPVAWNWIR